MPLSLFAIPFLACSIKQASLHLESRWVQRKWKEACFIEQAKNSIANRDNGMTLRKYTNQLLGIDDLRIIRF